MAEGTASASCTNCGHTNAITAPTGVCLAFWKCSNCGKTFQLPPGFCT